ncbi:MAG: V-type ATPase 116kDa subunit family protein [Treponemataceae bacterium]
MIVPMKKVHLVVLDEERESALKELRKLGTLHVVAKPAIGPSLDVLTEKLNRSENAFALVRDLKVEPKQGSSTAATTLVERILTLSEERKNLEEVLSRSTRELERLLPWGVLDPAALKSLAEAGIDFVPFEFTEKVYAALPENVRVMVLSRGNKTIRCVIFRESGVLPAGIPAEAVPLTLPDASTSELTIRRTQATERLQALVAEFTGLASEKEVITAHIARLHAEIEFDSTRLGMECLLTEEEGRSLVLLEGFVPASELNSVVSAAKKHGWAIIADDPAADEQVPTLVKNSPIVAMVQPIFDFLGTVPNYREYDVSAWFLLFFCFFFAMIFGDAVYGIILLVVGLVGAFLAKRAGKPVPAVFRLLITLSVFTIFWGVFTLTYLGIKPDLLPDFLKLIDIDWISNANPDSGEHIKILCFIIGTVQLSIAHIKNIKRDFATLKWLGQFGQLLMMVGMMNVVFNLVISSTRYPIPTYAFYLLIIGFALSFTFSNYEGNIIKSILASLVNFVSVFLGIVNVFADIVSYIRLWAVGLAGLAISETVNNMLGPMLGKMSLFVFGIFFLAFAHGFNIILGFLSVIVHGVRLNMLEFSGHLGMEWSGFEYRPFKERIVNNDATSKEQL